MVRSQAQPSEDGHPAHVLKHLGPLPPSSYYSHHIWYLLRSHEVVEVQDFRKITDHLRGIYRIYLELMKNN